MWKGGFSWENIPQGRFIYGKEFSLGEIFLCKWGGILRFLYLLLFYKRSLQSWTKIGRRLGNFFIAGRDWTKVGPICVAS